MASMSMMQINIEHFEESIELILSLHNESYS
jgi:hypothetical protein